MRVVDTFVIPGRGLVVQLSQTTDLPVGRNLAASITRPDGTEFTATASKVRLLRRDREPLESDDFFLHGLSKDDVPIGSVIRLVVER